MKKLCNKNIKCSLNYSGNTIRNNTDVRVIAILNNY